MIRERCCVHSRKLSRKRFVVIAVCITVVVICSVVLIVHFRKSNEDISDGTPPPLFYMDGKFFVFHGYTLDSLPDGCQYVRETINRGNALDEIDENFESNASGKIYKDKELTDVMYFQWNEWDESVYGKSPYLIFNAE